MYCKYCGKEIEDNAKFCRFCGKDLSGLLTQQKSIKGKRDGEKAISPILKKWYFWTIVALCIALITSLTVLLMSNSKEESLQTSESQNTENKVDEDKKEAESKEESQKDEAKDVDWLDKEYIVVSLYNKKTKKKTDISGGYGLKVNNSGTLVDVNDEEDNYWGQEDIDENIDVKIKKYGKGKKYITVYVNDSIAANGENLCIYGGTSLLNVHPLMDLSEYEAQTDLNKNDIVRIKVE